jgi:transposase
MSRWAGGVDSAKPLMPLVNGLKDSIIDYDIASMDVTTLQVLNAPDRSPTTKSYAYCFRGGGINHEAIVYEYNKKENKQFVKNCFGGFAGAVHSDADSFFGDLYAQDQVNSLPCNAHVRRKFQAITKTTKKKGLAHHAMSIYAKLYTLERKARREKFNAQQIVELRQKDAKPLLEKFKAWLDKNSRLVSPKAPIAKAINYTLRHWDGLTRYLTDGRTLIDNNHTEREIKPFVIARKNFLFTGSQDGARALCLHFSLIRSAKLHKLDPFQYYDKVMKIIPYLCPYYAK